MGRRSRRKGKTWERRVARLLRSIFGDYVVRGRQDRMGGASIDEGADVEGTPFWVECKHEHSANPRAALRQAAEMTSKKGDLRPCVAVTKDDKPPPGHKVGKALSPPIATMELSAWLDLVEDWARMKSALGEELVVPCKGRGNCR